jgi:hypothetical protein
MPGLPRSVEASDSPPEQPWHAETDGELARNRAAWDRSTWIQFADVFDQVNAYAAGAPTNVVNPEALSRARPRP